MRRLILLIVAIGIVSLGITEPALAQKKIDTILKDIDSKDTAKRLTALRDVGELADVKLSQAQMALKQIRDILAKDPDPKVRAAALGALGKIEAENKEYIANMMQYLKEDKDFGVQQTALALLGAYQQEAAGAINPLKERMGELRESAKDQDPGGIRSGILNTLAMINQNLGTPTSVEALKEDKAASVKITAANRLAQIGQQGGAKDAADDLIEAYTESLKAGPSPELRRSILGALSFISPDSKKYQTQLAETLKKDKDAGVIGAAIVALGRGGEAPKETVPLILEAAKNATANPPKEGNDPGGLRSGIMLSITKLGIEPKEVIPVLLDSLKKDKDVGVRIAVLGSLASLGDKAKDAIKPVADLQKAGAAAGLKDGNDPNDMRRILIDTLTKMSMDPKDLVPILISSTKDKNQGVRMTAVKLIGDLGPTAKSAEKTLTDLKKVPAKATPEDKAFAEAAGEALDKVKAK